MSQEHLFNHLDRYNDIVHIFHQESDRAAAILAASYLEVLLEQVLRTQFIDNSIVNDLFTGNGPASTFSSRISLCFALGYIDENIYRDLTLVRRIRNHFAHNIDTASFEDPEVRDRCSQFWLVKQSVESGQAEELPADARSQFLISVGSMNLRIIGEFRDEWLKRFGIVMTTADEIRTMSDNADSCKR
jgi:DNA-binding MltR family transcriptional regulator